RVPARIGGSAWSVFSCRHADHQHLPSFPTRRSSDLNSVATRNARLAAVHAFARFVATRAPEHVEACQRLLAVPTKRGSVRAVDRSEEHTSELQSPCNLVCRLLLEKKTPTPPPTPHTT